MKSGFNSLTEHFKVDDLPIKGKIPAWLNGDLLRNGPAKFDLGDKGYRHWFDGLSLLHNFSIKEGKVDYRNHFLESEAYKQDTKNKKISFRSFASDPCGGIFKRVFSGWYRKNTDNANVNITQIGEHFLALTETPMPIEFDAKTLETIGKFSYTDKLKISTLTAHPHLDLNTQISYNLVSHYGIQNSCYFYKLHPKSLTRIPFAKEVLKHPSYQHSFAMTKNYIIRTDVPFCLSHSLKLLFGKPFIENFHWDATKETVFSVFDKSSGKLLAKHRVPAFFTFHHANAYEKNNHINLDIVTYNDASIIKTLYLENLNKTSTPFPQRYLTRFSLPIHQGQVTTECISKNIELPRINYRYNMKDYRYVYGVGGDNKQIFNHLIKVDIKKKVQKIWKKQHCFPGEPVFVASPQAKTEDDGVVLSVVLNEQNQQSFLLILDAQNFEEQAIASLPSPLPFGLHGVFVSS